LADDVQIKFGGDVADALAAIERLKEAVGGLADPVARSSAQFAEAGAAFARNQQAMVGAQQQAAAEMQRLAEQNAAVQASLDKSYLAGFQRDMQILVDQKKITTQQALGFDIEYTAQLEEQERRRLEAMLASDDASAAEKLTTYQQLMQLDARYTAQVEEDQKKIADAARQQADRIQRSYEQAFDELGRSAQRNFNDILTGQTTWQKGAVKLMQDFETFFLDQIETMAAKWAASGLADLAGGTVASAVGGAQAKGGTGLGAGLMALVGISQPGGLFGTGLMSGGAAADTTAVTTAMTEMSSTTTSAMADMVTAVDSAMATVTGAAGTGGATTAGTDLAGAAAGGGAGGWGFSGLFDLLGFAQGGIVPPAIPSAAGGWALPSFSGATPALLHAREMVLPANLSQGLQDMIGAGGRAGDTHLHIHAIDSRSGAQFVMSQAHNIARALARAQRGFNPATMAR